LVTASTDNSSPSKVLDDDRAAGFAKHALAEHRADRNRRFSPRCADDCAFSGREPRRLHHERLQVRIHMRERGAELGERRACGGRHTRLPHDVLGEGLRRFDSRGGGDRTEDPEAAAAQRIGEARGERGLGTDYREINFF
jgi:hypothetical protein